MYAVDLATSCFLSSVFSLEELVDSLLPQHLKGLDPTITEALLHWELQTGQSPPPPPPTDELKKEQKAHSSSVP